MCIAWGLLHLSCFSHPSAPRHCVEGRPTCGCLSTRLTHLAPSQCPTKLESPIVISRGSLLTNTQQERCGAPIHFLSNLYSGGYISVCWWWHRSNESFIVSGKELVATSALESLQWKGSTSMKEFEETGIYACLWFKEADDFSIEFATLKMHT